MGIVARAQLRAELHCLSDDGLVVITAQHWSDPQAPATRPVSWLRLVRNGRIRTDRQVSGLKGHRELAEFWAERASVIAATQLDEDQMWKKLAELTGISQTRCVRSDCAGRMPVAWWRCPECRCHARNVAAGSMSGVRHRDLLLDLRTRRETR